ncbi:MAG: hypothetical protein ACXWSD_19735, partial [Bdellovibrionota bacterium]
MKTLLTLTLALSALTAHAGQEGYGGGLCEKANILCATPGDESRDGAVILCLWGDEKAKAFVSVEKDGGSGPSQMFNVVKIPVEPGLMGAPLRYEGQGLQLHIVVDAAPGPKGQPASISAHKLG